MDDSATMEDGEGRVWSAAGADEWKGRCTGGDEVTMERSVRERSDGGECE
jgi:hypothetical protein